MLKQDDPKKCTAAKLVKFGLANNVHKTSNKTLVLDPFAEKTLLNKDKKLIRSVTGIDCSWSLADKTFVKKFTILPESSIETLPDSTWNIEIIKDEQLSRLYYKITYITLE